MNVLWAEAQNDKFLIRLPRSPQACGYFLQQQQAERYDQKLEDVQEWLTLTEWSQKVIEEKTINTIQDKLFSLDIIKKKVISQGKF